MLSLYSSGNLLSSLTISSIISHSKSSIKACPKIFPFLLAIYALHSIASDKTGAIFSKSTGWPPVLCSNLFIFLLFSNNSAIYNTSICFILYIIRYIYLSPCLLLLFEVVHSHIQHLSLLHFPLYYLGN